MGKTPTSLGNSAYSLSLQRLGPQYTKGITMFNDYISHDAYLHPSSSSWAAGLHSLDVTRPVPSHHKPPTHRIAHNLQQADIHQEQGKERSQRNLPDIFSTDSCKKITCNSCGIYINKRTYMVWTCCCRVVVHGGNSIHFLKCTSFSISCTFILLLHYIPEANIDFYPTIFVWQLHWIRIFLLNWKMKCSFIGWENPPPS